MYLVNTTSGWNLGDDLIREGVFNLLGIKPTDSTLYINRLQVKHSGKWRPLWRVTKNFPLLDEIMPHIKMFIVAGTPEWINKSESVYLDCIKYDVPIKIVGVGMPQTADNIGVLRKAQHLISRCTVRDAYAGNYLTKCGFKNEWFYDPGIHAIASQKNKTIDTILNYRPSGGNGTHTDKDDVIYSTLYDRFRERIGLVTIHEPTEYLLAKNLFPDTEIFYSSNYVDYKNIYASCKHYIGGRIHGSVPALSGLADVHLIYRTKKVNSIRKLKVHMAARLGFSPILDYTHQNWSEITLREDLDLVAVKKLIRKDFEEHREYLKCIS